MLFVDRHVLSNVVRYGTAVQSVHEHECLFSLKRARPTSSASVSISSAHTLLYVVTPPCVCVRAPSYRVVVVIHIAGSSGDYLVILEVN